MRLKLYNLKRKFKKEVFKRYFKEFEKIPGPRTIYSDILEDEMQIIKSVEKFSITGIPRLASLIQAVKYVENNNIEGSIVECGVFKGGSVMAALQTLKNLNNLKRDFYLYDTFEGMTAPGFIRHYI